MTISSLPCAWIDESEPAERYRVSSRVAHGWDEYDAYLFDVDGTLLRSQDGVHVAAFHEAVAALTGERITLDGVALHGNTDTAILAEACARCGVATLEVHRAEILLRMAEIVETRRAELRFRRLPGVVPVLEWLRERGAALGVATGNLERIGWTKLEACGVREWFSFGGFSDQFPVRAEMVGDAARQARERTGIAGARICVVGDTPRDIEAARANGLDVIAVATGNFGFEALDALKPDFCCSSLEALMDACGTDGVQAREAKTVRLER